MLPYLEARFASLQRTPDHALSMFPLERMGAVADRYRMLPAVLPAWAEALLERVSAGPRAIEKIGDRLPSASFAGDVLARANGRLRVSRLAGIAWNDLGPTTSR